MAATAKKVDPHQIITVRNGFNGRLVYISPKSGETYVWDQFGDEQEMELSEVKSAKSSAKNFFINNWFMFDDEYRWVIDYIGVGQFYKNALDLDKFDDLFSDTPERIEEIVSRMSDGQKQSLAYRARQMVVDGSIDSRRVVAALERSLGVDLDEK